VHNLLTILKTYGLTALLADLGILTVKDGKKGNIEGNMIIFRQFSIFFRL